MRQNAVMDKERMEVALLAHRRYPDMPLDLALMCFESDRRRAGLGALDDRKRRGVEVFRSKRLDFASDLVIYRFGIARPAREEYVPQDWMDFDPSKDYSTLTVQRVKIPAHKEKFGLNVRVRDFYDQRTRNLIARQLRNARRPSTVDG